MFIIQRRLMLRSQKYINKYTNRTISSTRKPAVRTPSQSPFKMPCFNTQPAWRMRSGLHRSGCKVCLQRTTSINFPSSYIIILSPNYTSKQSLAQQQVDNSPAAPRNFTHLSLIFFPPRIVCFNVSSLLKLPPGRLADASAKKVTFKMFII